MPQFNLLFDESYENIYANGYLPQRNKKNLWYQESSSRSNLSLFSLSSENRRILKKTDDFNFTNQLTFSPLVQKDCYQWSKKLEWDFPSSSIKTVFKNHIFNYFYQWSNSKNEIVAYSVCYFSQDISHIAYVFYNPQYAHQDLPIRLTLQTIIDSHQKGLKYCYLGRFDPAAKQGFYKRTMPGFEYFVNGTWKEYNK